MTRIVLLAGPSGSGKSRLARLLGAHPFRLDDFYRDAGGDLPRAHGIVDWDDPRTWDGAGAVAALAALVRDGVAEVPVYSIAESRRTGMRRETLGECRMVVAEGIFAIELLGLARAAGLVVDPVYLDRNRTLVGVLRLRRDLARKRKPPLVLLRRGYALWRGQPALRRRALAAGFRPLPTMRAAIRELSGD
ncbi:hypothetical protein [Propioniciclava soli]|uniref:hypothetical protein n=1 Tax=Propioniciclava soli TaxID=2775081 RepID=UPI001E3969AD